MKLMKKILMTMKKTKMKRMTRKILLKRKRENSMIL
jgi:hypothetical protein